LIVTLCRNGQVRAVNGKTRLRAGDELIILAPPEHMRSALHCLTGQAAEEAAARQAGQKSAGEEEEEL
jgi:Trk K+ transport system NAD-binding subunit